MRIPLLFVRPARPVDMAGVTAQAKIGVAIGLFIIALLPRLFGLGLFLTSDEPLWYIRSIAFAEALTGGQWADTLQTGHPGVTTMWSGTLGLGAAYLWQNSAASFPAYLQSLSHDSDRIDVELLPWVRLPTVVLAALCIAWLYWWSTPLLGHHVALVAALLLAFDPLLLAHSRTLHHDALATIFISLSLLALLNYVSESASRRVGEGVTSSLRNSVSPRNWMSTLRVTRSVDTSQWRITSYPSSSIFHLCLSGGFAGLALLSKGSALILVGFVGLLLLWLWLKRRWPLQTVILAGVIWLAVAAGSFVLLWPALWVKPGQTLSEVFGWIIASTEGEDVGETASTGWAGAVPDLGLLFYPVNWLLKSTLLSWLGLAGLIGWWRETRHQPQRWVIVWLAMFALLFTLFLALGDKRDGRYLLPIYPAMALLAAAGLMWIYDFAVRAFGGFTIYHLPFTIYRQPSNLPTFQPSNPPITNLPFFIFTLLLLAFSLPWYPYYHSYYNPLIGGSWLAPRLIKVGWGEGMEQVAAYLNGQDNASSLVVATSYANTFLPFFKGTAVKHHQLAPSDYVLMYVRQMQNGYPFPEYGEYYRPRPPLFSVREDGLDYAWLYPGPHINIVRNVEFEDGVTLMGFVLNRAAAQPGQPNLLTLIWRIPPAGVVAMKDQPVQVQLRNQEDQIMFESGGPLLAGVGPSPVEGHYRLNISADMPRGDYELWVAVGQGANLSYQKAGLIPVRQLDKPSLPWPAEANFGNLLTFAGAEVIPPNKEGIVKLKLLWQARHPIPQSYTTFVHLVDVQGHLWGQADRVPQVNGVDLPANQWETYEWIVDEFEVALKPGAPAGNYTVLVGVYDPQTLERLPLMGAETGTTVDVTTITLPSSGAKE
ncbi:MAG: glycosyltransferase family 39 protein [Anaerolineae bacterium]